ncbi:MULTISPECIES: hypothetical protein [unclassified Bradyrhizobium]|uniref:hypothetical protein n=1 Tax=unclassified Bradyrhizobium TaxID=2631580 RepID=UPI0029161CE9|nr:MULTISPECIES: hypothetical protein [unclassified Bradyrhizobium]
MTQHLMSDFRALRALIFNRRERLRVYMPRCDIEIVEAAFIPGTRAYALIRCVCMIIAEEIAYQEFMRQQQPEISRDDA